MRLLGLSNTTAKQCIGLRRAVAGENVKSVTKATQETAGVRKQLLGRVPQPGEPLARRVIFAPVPATSAIILPQLRRTGRIKSLIRYFIQ